MGQGQQRGGSLPRSTHGGAAQRSKQLRGFPMLCAPPGPPAVLQPVTTMEGRRAWALAAPAWGAPAAAPPSGTPAPPAGIYVPRGWKLKRRRQGSDDRGPSKRHRAAPAAAPPAAPPTLAPRVPRPPPNPAQLAPLRCSWPHPAVVDLLARQAWPAAGAAALGPRPADPAAPALPWWNRMLPSQSLPHPPLAPEQQRLLQAASDGAASSSGAAAEPLPQPNVLVGYEVRQLARWPIPPFACCLPAAGARLRDALARAA